MFEVGAKYRIVTGLGEEEGSSSYTVKAVELPLLKVVDGVGQEYIFNTSSPSFVSASRAEPNFVRKPSIYAPPKPPTRAVNEEGWPKED